MVQRLRLQRLKATGSRINLLRNNRLRVSLGISRLRIKTGKIIIVRRFAEESRRKVLPRILRMNSRGRRRRLVH